MRKIKCPECGKYLKEEKVTVSFPSNPHGQIDISATALICKKCRVKLIPENESDRILRKVKEIKDFKVINPGR